MKLLLDTHVFIWADGEPNRLSAAARSVCEDPVNQLVLSVASIWEMQLKLMLGDALREFLLPKQDLPACLRASTHRQADWQAGIECK